MSEPSLVSLWHAHASLSSFPRFLSLSLSSLSLLLPPFTSGYGLLALFGLNTLWHLYNVLKARFFVPAEVAALSSDQKRLLGVHGVPQGSGQLRGTLMGKGRRME